MTIELVSKRGISIDEVGLYLGTVKPKTMSEIARRFAQTAEAMRPIVEALIKQGAIVAVVIGKGRRYGARKAEPIACAPAPPMKLLKANPEQEKRLAEIRAYRNKFPSRHF